MDAELRDMVWWWNDSVRLGVGLDGLDGLLQPEQFCDSVLNALCLHDGT